MEYEYGIERTKYPISDGYGPARTGMTEDQALQFLAEWLADGGAPGTWSIVYRPIPTWGEYWIDADRLADLVDQERAK